MKARKVKTILGLAVAACAMIVIWLRPWEAREPVYQGKPLSSWMMELELDKYYGDDGNFHAPADAQEVMALDTIGPAAVPYLVKWLSVKEHFYNPGLPSIYGAKPPLLSRLRELKDRIVPPKPAPEPPSKDDVVLAFRLLGPEVKSAIPELAKLANAAARSMVTSRPSPGQPSPGYFRDKDFLRYSVQSLACLGPDAVPAMLMVATNLQSDDELWFIIKQLGEMGTNGVAAAPALLVWSRKKEPVVHDAAVIALIEMRKELEVVLPFLLASLNEPVAVRRRYAAEVLGDFGKKARPALPDLLKAMNDLDPETRQAIIDAIKKIDPTALK